MELYIPPDFGSEEDSSDKIAKPSDESHFEIAPQKHDLEVLAEEENEEQKVIDYSQFNSSEFNEVDTLLTNVEDYAQKIRDDVDHYARNVREEVDLLKSEIELELAQALVKRLEAEKKAKETIDNAEATKNAVHEESRNAGFNAGKKLGYEEFKDENSRISGNALSILKELQHLRSQIHQEFEEHFIKLALLISKKIAHNELKTEKSFISEMLRESIQHFEGKGNITITVNPIEFEYFAKYQSEFQNLLESDQIVKIRTNSSISPAAPVIESDFSVVNLDMKKQFDEIDQHLQDCIEERRALFNE